MRQLEALGMSFGGGRKNNAVSTIKPVETISNNPILD
jgi:hypothetical protein